MKTPTGSTEEISLPSSSSASSCLYPSTALRLAAAAADLERRFGGARDVEFAVRDGQIFLLQSRPVTAVESAWTDFELATEMDAAVVAATDDVNTKANVG